MKVNKCRIYHARLLINVEESASFFSRGGFLYRDFAELKKKPRMVLDTLTFSKVILAGRNDVTNYSSSKISIGKTEI